MVYSKLGHGTDAAEKTISIKIFSGGRNSSFVRFLDATGVLVPNIRG